MLVNHTMVFQFCRPIWDLWVRYALMTGVLDGSVDDYRQVRWVAPPARNGWTQPRQPKVLGFAGEGAQRLHEPQRGRGYATDSDAEQVEAEIHAENQRADSLGLVS